MSDTYGPIPIPLPAPTDGVPSTDPALWYLLQYLKAFLNTDQNATAAWQAAGVAPSTPPVIGTHVFDPEEGEFKTQELPALFAWRTDGPLEQLADDYRVATDTVKLVWVFPMGTQQQYAARHAFANGLVKAIDTGIDRGRTTGWVVPNDPDPMAPAYGSELGAWMDDWQFWPASWKRRAVTLRGRDGATLNTFPAVEITCKLSENRVIDITRDPPFDVPDPKGSVITILDGDSGRQVDQGYASDLEVLRAKVALIPGAILWVRADSGLYTQSGLTVSSAKNLANGGIGDAVAVAGERPSVALAFPGGNAFRFSGAQRMIAPIPPSFAGDATSIGFSVWSSVVFRSVTTNLGVILNTARPDPQPGEFGGMEIAVNALSHAFAVVEDDTPFPAGFQSSDAAMPTGPHIVSGARPPAGPTQLYIDGAAIGTPQVHGVVGATVAQTVATIGGWPANVQALYGAAFINADIREIFLLNRAANDAERVLIDAYMKASAGL